MGGFDCTVAGLWRYPVKSMAGEELESAEVGPGGIAGDREWALRDERRQEIADARKLPALLDLRVAYTADAAGTFGEVEVLLPGGGRIRSGDPGVHKAISELAGTDVTLWRRPADDPEHYRRIYLDGEDPVQEAMELFQVNDVDEVVEIATQLLPPEVIEHHTVPGTYFDVAPLHLVTDRSLATLGRSSPGSDADVHRFRPNILIQMGENGPSGAGGSGAGDGDAASAWEDLGEWGDLPEADWVGRRFRFGTAVLRVTGRTPRCVMTTHPVGGLPRDREILRTIHREFDHCLGVYAEVERPGTVRIGDVIEPL